MKASATPPPSAYEEAFTVSAAVDTFDDAVHAVVDLIWQRALSAAPVMAEATGTVIDEIAAERRRQVEAEGWTAKHDDAHADGALAMAAAVYASNDKLRRVTVSEDAAVFHDPWPWFNEYNGGRSYVRWRAWFKPKDRRRDLIRAGALIVAEIERLDRKSSLNAALAIAAGQLGEKESRE